MPIPFAHPLSIVDKAQTLWPASRLHELQFLGQQAAQLDMGLYLVGGVLRDLFLDRVGLDWDLALEGDLQEFLELLQNQHGYGVEKSSPFFTLRLLGPENRWDLARCRGESYAQPAALPSVYPADLTTDLRRRDFRINAMAMDLHPNRFGTLLDPYDGRRDLADQILEVLHHRSFRDDPTRILRGLRFSLRFDMDLGPLAKTCKDQVLADGIFALLSGTRLFRELQYLLHLPQPHQSLERFCAWGLGLLLPALHAPDPRLWQALQRLSILQQRWREDFPLDPLSSWLAVLMLLCFFSTPEERERHWQHWQWSPPAAWRRDLFALPAAAPPSSAARTARYWRPWTPEGILVALALGDERMGSSAWHYWKIQRRMRLPVDGKILQDWGIPPGPALGKALEMLQDAQWNGEIHDQHEAYHWLKTKGLLHR